MASQELLAPRKRIQNFLHKVNILGPYPHKKACELYPEICRKRCWIWTGSIDSAGYGITRLFNQWLAHRASWIIWYGTITPLGVRHKCDNRRCVRPSHLFEGDAQADADDKCSKGRQFRPKGILNNKARLSEKQVIQMRKEYATDKYTLSALGILYNVSLYNVWHIIKRRTWKHI